MCILKQLKESHYLTAAGLLAPPNEVALKPNFVMLRLAVKLQIDAIVIVVCNDVQNFLASLRLKKQQQLEWIQHTFTWKNHRL